MVKDRQLTWTMSAIVLMMHYVVHLVLARRTADMERDGGWAKEVV